VGAAILSRGLYCALTGRTQDMTIKHLLAACDAQIHNQPNAKHTVSGFLWLAGKVFPAHALVLPCRGLGLVARDRWVDGLPHQPDPKALRMIANIHWREIVQSKSSQYLVLVKDIISRKWHV